LNSPDHDKTKVLFLCTGNSCRSQMAEGWARHLKGDSIEAASAGVCPVPVNLRAVQVMAEAGVDISHHTSKHIDDLADIVFDYVITVCDNARQLCPVFAGRTTLIHKSFADPSFIAAPDEAVTNAFRAVRDQIKAFVETLPDDLPKYARRQQGTRSATVDPAANSEPRQEH